jgi:hypothetical protein
MGWMRAGIAAACAWAMCSCGDGGKAAPAPAASPPVAPAPPALEPPRPLRIGHWAYFGTAQGLSPDVRDVSPDEGGNVYVAAWDAVYAKRRDDDAFRRFDSENAGLSRKCNDAAFMTSDFPPAPFFQCPVVAVAGAAPGKAFVGFENVFGQAADSGADWAHEAGGADVVAFDAESGTTMTRVRHVLTGAPPHVVCDTDHDQWVPTCSTPDGWWWNNGRRLMRSVRHIAVNHDRSSLMYGDAWMGGEHSTLSVLLENAEQRGWVDIASQFGPKWADAKDFWEHHHPAVDYLGCDVPGCYWQIVGQGEGISIDPRNGRPWGSNGLRTTSISAYGESLTYRQWGMENILDLWPDDATHPYYGPMNDRVRALSHCADGTLWIASQTHGLARRDPAGALSYLHLPDDSAGAIAIACDWSDGSLWIGLGTGGLLRLAGDRFEDVAVAGAPDFAHQPVLRIQADRWSSAAGRILYFAFGALLDDQGRITAPGGIAAYDGP